MGYLDKSRSAPEECGQLRPFAREGVVEAHRLVEGVPGPMLALLRRVMEYAVGKDWGQIEAEHVREVFQTQAPREPETKVEDEELPPSQVDLRT